MKSCKVWLKSSVTSLRNIRRILKNLTIRKILSMPTWTKLKKVHLQARFIKLWGFKTLEVSFWIYFLQVYIKKCLIWLLAPKIIFVTGIETTSTALTWSTLYMIKYPEIQSKVQAEIHDKVGLSRPVTMEDKINLPFTEAVIHEILRYNFFPFFLIFPHFTA